MVAGLGLASCTNQAHCPGVAGTGNSATHKGGSRKAHCAGTASTGNFKPKVRNKKEDGLYSKKMARAMRNAPTNNTSNAAPEQQQ